MRQALRNHLKIGVGTEDTKVEEDDKERRETLIQLAEDGEIDKSVAYIKKASKKAIDKLYAEC